MNPKHPLFSALFAIPLYFIDALLQIGFLDVAKMNTGNSTH